MNSRNKNESEFQRLSDKLDKVVDELANIQAQIDRCEERLTAEIRLSRKEMHERFDALLNKFEAITGESTAIPNPLNEQVKSPAKH